MIKFIKKYQRKREWTRLEKARLVGLRYDEWHAQRVREEAQREKGEQIISICQCIPFVNSVLLLYGNMAGISFGMSIAFFRISKTVHDVYGTYHKKEFNGAFPIFVSLFFSGAAFCFKSRSMELLGGSILLFYYVMLL